MKMMTHEPQMIYLGCGGVGGVGEDWVRCLAQGLDGWCLCLCEL